MNFLSCLFYHIILPAIITFIIMFTFPIWTLFSLVTTYSISMLILIWSDYKCQKEKVLEEEVKKH